MSIVRLVQEERVYVPKLLPIIGSSNGLLAFVGTTFEPIVELCISNGNEYQHRYKENSQSMKNTKSMKEILTIRQTSVVPRE